MRNPMIVLTMVTSITLAAAMAPALARGGGGGGGGGHGGFVNGEPRGFTQGQKLNHGWANSGGVPPGWAHGQRRGWGTNTTPPGWNR